MGILSLQSSKNQIYFITIEKFSVTFFSYGFVRFTAVLNATRLLEVIIP